MSPDADPDPGDTVGAALTVVVNDETSDSGAGDIDRWVSVARSTLQGEAVQAGRLDVIFVDDEAMAGLNRKHMGGDGPTDVLAFPLDGPDSQAATPIHLGDVVVCPAVARRQAPEHCGSFDAEMVLLVVHGVLHVLGYDHARPDETAAMQARERWHLDRHGLTHPVPAAPTRFAAVRESRVHVPKNRA